MASFKIDQKITKVKVIKEEEPSFDLMHEDIERPERLVGSTYKVKTPLSDHSLYVTINDYVLNEGTEAESRHPFEMFINSKNMDHFQWIVALTRIISSVFRKGGDVAFLLEELKSVFDPKGGYFKKGGKYMPSLVAEIGDVLEDHLRNIGIIEKKETKSNFPDSAILCPKCNTKAMIKAEGCLTCLNCGDSRCS